MSLIIYYKIHLSDTILSIELPIDATVKTLIDGVGVDYKKYMFTYNDINYLGSSEELLADLGICSQTMVYIKRIPKKKVIVIRLSYQKEDTNTTRIIVEGIGLILNLPVDISNRKIMMTCNYGLCSYSWYSKYMYVNRYQVMEDLGDEDELFGDEPIDKKFFGDIPVLETIRILLKNKIPKDTVSPHEWLIKNLPNIYQQIHEDVTEYTHMTTVVDIEYNSEDWLANGLPDIPVDATAYNHNPEEQVSYDLRRYKVDTINLSEYPIDYITPPSSPIDSGKFSASFTWNY